MPLDRWAPKIKQGRQGDGQEEGKTLRHARTHAHTRACPHTPSIQAPSDVACSSSSSSGGSSSISVGGGVGGRRRQTGVDGHTVEFGDDGVLTAVPRIVIGTPDGGKTRHRGGEGWG